MCWGNRDSQTQQGTKLRGPLQETASDLVCLSPCFVQTQAGNKDGDEDGGCIMEGFHSVLGWEVCIVQ